MPIRLKIKGGAATTEEVALPDNRTALLKELVKSDPNSQRARQILDSLRKYQPKSNQIRTYVRNPVTGITATATRWDPRANTVVFDSTKTGFSRPKTPNSALDQLGIRATINQLINELPTREQAKQPGVSNQYEFSPLKDAGEKAEGNQRAAAYRRATRGAFDAQPRKDGYWKGVGSRIDQDTWQPRNAKGQFGKYVKFNPVTQDNILPRIAKQVGRMATKRALGAINPIAQGLMTADDLIEGVTGFSPAELTIKGSQKTLEDMYNENPEANIGSILPF